MDLRAYESVRCIESVGKGIEGRAISVGALLVLLQEHTRPQWPLPRPTPKADSTGV